MNHLLLCLVTLLAAATAAKLKEDKTVSPRPQLSDEAKAHMAKFKDLRTTLRKEEKELWKKYSKDIVKEVRAYEQAEKKAKNNRLHGKNKGVKTTIAPKVLSDEAKKLYDAVRKLRIEQKTMMQDFKKNTDPKVAKELKEYHHGPGNKKATKKPKKE